MDWYSTVLLDQSEHCLQHGSHTTRKSFLTFPLFDIQAGIKPPTFCFDDLLHVECTSHGLTVSLLALLAPAAGQTAGDGGVNTSVRCTEDSWSFLSERNTNTGQKDPVESHGLSDEHRIKKGRPHWRQSAVGVRNKVQFLQVLPVGGTHNFNSNYSTK